MFVRRTRSKNWIFYKFGLGGPKMTGPGQNLEKTFV